MGWVQTPKIKEIELGQTSNRDDEIEDEDLKDGDEPVLCVNVPRFKFPSSVFYVANELLD